MRYLLLHEEASEAVLAAPLPIGSVLVAIATSRRFPTLQVLLSFLSWKGRPLCGGELRNALPWKADRHAFRWPAWLPSHRWLARVRTEVDHPGRPIVQHGHRLPVTICGNSFVPRLLFARCRKIARPARGFGSRSLARELVMLDNIAHETRLTYEDLVRP